MTNLSFTRVLKAWAFVSALVCCLFCIRIASAADDMERCIKHEDHKFVTFFLVDRSDKLSDIEAFKQTVSSLKQMIREGERLVVGVSTGKLSETRVVMDVSRPEKSLWESPLKIRAKEKIFSDCFAEMERSLLPQDEAHKSSALIETLQFVSTTLGSDAAPAKRLVMFSDMMQNSDTLSFYSVKVVDPETSLKKLQKDQMVWKFKNLDVYISGAGVGVPDDKARKIEQFWRKYFEQSGAALKFYGPVFLGTT